MSKPPAKPHTRADHTLGALFDHIHDGEGDHDHDHDHDMADGLIAAGGDADVVLTSIGIDVGSSGTQVAFSRLLLEHNSDGAGGRMSANRRETIYQSPVSLTPFSDGGPIDTQALASIVDHAFAAANLTPDDIDCGVVILTGAARERGNAGAITRELADRCGDIVSASAGHHMEARLAAHGSGAVMRSATTGKRFLNIDIGGATTKLAICDSGRVRATAALDIGGRLAATTQGDRIVRLEPSGQLHAARAGFQWWMGGAAPAAERGAVARQMALDLLAALTQWPPPTHVAELFVTQPLGPLSRIDGVIISGGVGEYVYGRETRGFGDLGLALGRALIARIDDGALPWPLMPAAECIRATVLGASAYSVQLSGRTGYISNAGTLLPRRNCPVLHPLYNFADAIDAQGLAMAIQQHLAAFDIGDDRPDLVLAFRWQGLPEYQRLKSFAEGLQLGLAGRIAHGLPLLIMVDGDVAASLGAILQGECDIANDLLVLDGIELADFDFVDLGRVRLPSETVPITIKSLVFRDDPEIGRGL